MNIALEIAEELVSSHEYVATVRQLSEALRNERQVTFVPGLSTRWVVESEKTQLLLEKICSSVTDHVRSRYFSGNLKLIDVKLLRHLKSSSPARKEGAFMWHTDNHPPNILNAMVYLVDVDESNGPMQYCIENEKVVKFDYSPPLGGKVKEDLFAQNRNLEIKSMTGSAGTTFIFSNCILHRAGSPLEKERDVLIIQIEETA